MSIVINDYRHKQAVTIVRNQRLTMEELLVDETIFSCANGLLGTRGHFTEGYGDKKDYPQTYINGVYNTFPYHYEENSIQFPQIGQTIVNLPDASLITIETESEKINLSDSTLVSLERSYNLNQGCTSRTAVYKTKLGYVFKIIEEKCVSQIQKDCIVVNLTIETINYKGVLRLKSYLRMPILSEIKTTDPRVGQAKNHLYLSNISIKGNYAILTAKTKNTNIDIKVGITHSCSGKSEIVNDQAIVTFDKNIEPNEKITITKYQIYHSSHLIDKNDIDDVLIHVKSFEYYKSKQEQFYLTFWKEIGLYISQNEINEAVQYNVFQLFNSGGDNDRIQIAAKGLSGEGYEGHYFWDTEIYMLPFFILNYPEKAKNILLYRYHNLDKARIEARKLGVSRGAKIPWRTIDGTEASPYFLAGSAQIHINSDIAFGVMQYYHATLDLDFMYSYGFELLLETALFIYDYGHFKGDKFHIDGVTGPDEYTVLVNDNFYTNKMAKKHFENVCKFGLEHHKNIENVLTKVGVDQSIFHNLANAAKCMTLLIDKVQHIAIQDANFMNKKILDLSSIPQIKHPMLLHYHPLYIYRHQILKQSDAVLALILTNERSKLLFRNSFNYYLPITTHDSSLSKCMYGIAAYKLKNTEIGYDFLKDSIQIDLENKKNHTQHGLHMANMGGSYLLIIMGLLGLHIDEMLSINPVSQDNITAYEFNIKFQGIRLFFGVKDYRLTITSSAPIRLKLGHEIVLIDKSFSALIKRA
ncbi:MAG TPA: glycosyl hydrolase family 65 protein [Erysipelotrichaceae bacterium]|nr:glycosyl hydrolase family 65 protein [Erysipelotrichaceae bacterium]